MSENFATPELVEKKVQQLFAPQEWPEVWAILNDLKFDSGDGARVQLAMLKSSGGEIKGLRCSLLAANRDWRDVIAGAEYPKQMSYFPKTWSEGKPQEVMKEDRQQYLDWLNDDGNS